ncbi:MAG: hypothetical protein DHS20C15_07560 [Planctomycetota bacterium]|nr:MAG: hypothetical protein DHS20C15_07560 [Planctomycetota bacterium]
MPTDAALLAELLAPRHANARWERRAQRLLERAGGLARLARLEAGELAPCLGYSGPASELGAVRLSRAFELGRRAACAALQPGQAVRRAEDLHAHLMGWLSALRKECFVVVLLDAQHRLLRSERVSEGCLTWSVVHPREVFAPALRAAAAAVVVAHNHPSGDPTPSHEDREVTRRLVDAGQTLGIPLLDHLVVGHGRCVSLREAGAWGAS